MSYVYIKSEDNLWTVGFYDPKGNWHTDSDHNDKNEAANRVAWLNGSSCMYFVKDCNHMTKQQFIKPLG